MWPDLVSCDLDLSQFSPLHRLTRSICTVGLHQLWLDGASNVLDLKTGEEKNGRTNEQIDKRRDDQMVCVMTKGDDGHKINTRNI